MGHDKDGRWVETSMAGVLQFYSGQLLNDKPDLKGGEELMKAARAYPEGLSKVCSSR